MPNFYSPRLVGSGNPLRTGYDGVPITPSDSVDVPAGPAGGNGPCCGFFVGGAGNVTVQLITGGTATFTGMSAGQYVDAAVKRVMATGTTATGLAALFDLQV